METKPIRTDLDYEQALREIERLWGAEEGTADGESLDVLVTLVEAYERKHFPIGARERFASLVRRVFTAPCSWRGPRDS